MFLSMALVVILYFNVSYLVHNYFFQFIVRFIIYTCNVFIKISSVYFKAVWSAFIGIKSLFFSSLIPSIIQFVILFHLLFDYVWKIYLLSLIISLFFVTPYFIFIYTTDKIVKADIKCLINEIKFLISFFLFVIVNPSNATAVVAVLFVADLCVADYKNKKKRYLLLIF